MSLLKAKHLHAGYGGEEVLHDVSLEIEPGQFTGIIGPNGCGKSTLLRCLTRLLRPTRGTVLLDGRELQHWNPRELARFMAVVPQAMPEVLDLSVRDFVALGRHPYVPWLATPASADAQVVDQALRLCGLNSLSERKLNTLSGGERQRARIALAVAQKPVIMLLDEPIAFLDIRHQLELLDLISELIVSHGMTAVLVLHDLNLAARYCDRIVAMRGGRIVASGSTEQVVTPVAIARVFDVLVKIGIDPLNDSKVCSFYRMRTPAPYESGSESETQFHDAAEGGANEEDKP